MRSRKNPAKASVLLCAACAPLVGSGSAFGQISIATVPVAYVNNAPDTAHNNFGSVGYEYNIGTYDVTSSQYCAFLNAVAANDVYGLYHPNMASTTEGNPGIIQNGSPGSYTYTVIDGRGNYPATDVSFFNAARFANWLDNGQPVGAEGVGTTETGAYTLSPTMDASVAALPPGQKQNYESSTQDNDAVVRSATASWAVPTENEWYKAAYFDPDRNPANYVGDYWYFPDRTDTSQIAETQMTFNISGNVNDTTPVGTYPDPSFVGTYDQGGDVYQWNESIPGGGGVRGIRGGAFDGNDVGYAADFESSKQQPWITGSVGNNGDIGFRVVQLNPLATGGLMDMSNKTVILSGQPAGAIANIMSQLQTGFNNGHWNGTSGITSTTAAADTTHLTAVGYMINDTGANTGNPTGYAIYNALGGQSTSDGDIDIAYTYYGDANLSGSVDGSDYSLIDNGYQNHLTGWYNGDFNYDGVVNGSDYTLIDNAFNSQGQNLAGIDGDYTAQITAQLAGGSVPEPTSMMLLGVASLGLLCRRRKAM